MDVEVISAEHNVHCVSRGRNGMVIYIFDDSQKNIIECSVSVGQLSSTPITEGQLHVTRGLYKLMSCPRVGIKKSKYRD